MSVEIYLTLIVSLGAVVTIEPYRSVAPIDNGQSIESAVREASEDGRVVTPSAEELETVRRLFYRTFLADDPSSLVDEWAEVKMEVQRVDDPVRSPHRIWIIREAVGAKRGRGVYAIRPNAKYQYALQMPHSFHDRYTREIGLHLFQQSPLRSAAWNSIPRTKVDVAHTRLHYFNSFTTAFTDAHPGGVVIQLHGFAQHKRTPDAMEADCIVSDGTRHPPQWVGQIARTLDEKFEEYATLLFPAQVDDLGATTNRQARLIYGNSTASFLHVEMSRPLRDALRKQSDLRYDFFTSILMNCRR